MPKWVMLAKAKVLNVNFSEDEKTIEDAFKRICEPVCRVPGILVRTNSLVVGDITYTLGIAENKIEITFFKDGKENRCSYFVSNGKYSYKAPKDTIATNFKPLESLEFDYETILNNLMDIALSE